MRQFSKRLLALLLVCALTLSLTGGALAAEETDGSVSLSYEQLPSSSVSAQLIPTGASVTQADPVSLYGEDETVRVMIVLKGSPAITRRSMGQAQVASYRRQLELRQDQVAREISSKALDGESLDVVWGLTLTSNAISANVEYGKIEDIAALSSVKAVYIEPKYSPMTADHTDNVAAQATTGVSSVKTDVGYSGSGSRIAVIDTGTDTDHQSFDAAAFEYALSLEAQEQGLTLEEYEGEDHLDLLTADEIEGLLSQLNVSRRYDDLTADKLYLNAKLPFAFNYIDGDLDVTHDNDNQGEHGSHVAGIAAANAYIPAYDFNGDGVADSLDAQAVLDYAVQGTAIRNSGLADLSGDGRVTAYDARLLLDKLDSSDLSKDDLFADAAESVFVTGVAPNAQIITMKVFGKGPYGQGDGCYPSDYMAAVEDAIVLGCDTVNLSLGSAYAGYNYSRNCTGEESRELIDYIRTCMEDVSDSGIVMCVAAGNSGNWADNDAAFQAMYADEAGTANISNPSTYMGAFSVASSENAGGVSTERTVFTGADGSEFTVPLSTLGGETKPWNTLDTVVGNDPSGAPQGSSYDVVFLGDPSNLFAGAPQTDNAIYGGTQDAFSGYDYAGKIVLIARGGSQDLNEDGEISDDERFTFYAKHTNAALAGAAAVLIYNNVPGSAGSFSVEGSESDIPCMALTLGDAATLYAAFAAQGGKHVGTVTVTDGMYASLDSDPSHVSMSDFSSWGTIGALTIQPEITAPGGGIYSVNGSHMDSVYNAQGVEIDRVPDGGSAEYEHMNGTSMATPHVAGLAALMAQYIRETPSLAAFMGANHLTNQQLIESLLMSTATPLVEGDHEYSVRNQGAGLANVASAIASESVITMDGRTDGKVKAELGDEAKFTDPSAKSWSFGFTVHNLTDQALSYDLSQSILTTDTQTLSQAELTQAGFSPAGDTSLSLDAMVELGATVTYAGSNVSGSTLTVAADASSQVTVTLTVDPAAAAAMAAKGYTNGFFVEGYIYLTPTQGDANTTVAHSIPLLGWYGNWSAPSMYDSGSYIEYYYDTLTRPSHINSSTKNVLTVTPPGGDEGLLYNGNIYADGTTENSDGAYIEARNALNSTPDRAFDFYAIFPTLIRNVSEFKLEITATDPDGSNERLLYLNDYEDDGNGDDSLMACFFNPGALQWYDTTPNYGLGPNYDAGSLWHNGGMESLREGDKVTISATCLPEYYNLISLPGQLDTVDWDNLDVGEGATLSWTFTVDNTAPQMTSTAMSADGKTLTVTGQDNRFIAAAVLLDGSATQPIKYVFPDMPVDQMGNSVTASFDITDFAKDHGNKAVIALCDYAGNQTFWAVNLKGEGQPYGEFVGMQYSDSTTDTYWVSFDKDAARNETTLFYGDKKYVCAEYVGGYIYAQDETGCLYAIPYADMLANETDLEPIFLAQMENTYQDLAYNYSDGTLYGLCIDRWGVAIYGINMEEKPPQWAGMDPVPPYSEEMLIDVNNPDDESTGAVNALALACDDDGSFYVMACISEEETTDEETGEVIPAHDTTAQLWKSSVDEEWGGYTRFTLVGDTGISMNYLQSMTWDHNTEKLYWARFDVVGFMRTACELYEVDPASAACTKTGTLSAETACLMAPLTAEAAAKAEHAGIPHIDATETGRPVLTQSVLSLGLGSTAQLTYNFDPWYTDDEDVTWSSSDPSIATVDQNGLVTGVAGGSCTVTVSNTQDPSYFSTCAVTVASLSLEIEGIVTAQSSGVGNATGVSTYTFTMTDGVPQFGTNDSITAEGEFEGFGLQLAASTLGPDGYIWASEYGNAGMIYKIDPQNGKVVDMLEPINGDMSYGMDYSPATGMFTTIMNMYINVDIPMDDSQAQKMWEGYDEETHEFTWHRFNMLPYLLENQNGFVTGETGDGASSEVVFCGVTHIDNDPENPTPYTLYEDYQGNSSWDGCAYTPDTTLVLLDNVGRLWYMDEITGMKKVVDEYAGELYVPGDADESMGWYEESIPASWNGVQVMPDENGTYSVFVLRALEETPLTDMFRQGTLPRYTYHFSSIYFAGMVNTTYEAEEFSMEADDFVTVTKTAQVPAFFLSLYDYWNDGTTNNLYLLVAPTTISDMYTGTTTTTPATLFDLGNTGEHNIIATIHSGSILGGLPGNDPVEEPPVPGADATLPQSPLFVDIYQKR